MLQAAGARKGARGRDRRGDAGVRSDRHLRRRVRPAAQRPRRARRGGRGALRPRPTSHVTRRRRPGAQARRRSGRGPARARAARVRRARRDGRAASRTRTRSTRSRPPATTTRSSSSAPTSSPTSRPGASRSGCSSWRASASRRAPATRESRPSSPSAIRILRARSHIRSPRPRSARRARAGEPLDGLVAARRRRGDRGARALPGRLTSGFVATLSSSDFARTSPPDRRSRAARSWQKTSSSST